MSSLLWNTDSQATNQTDWNRIPENRAQAPTFCFFSKNSFAHGHLRTPIKCLMESHEDQPSWRHSPKDWRLHLQDFPYQGHLQRPPFLIPIPSWSPWGKKALSTKPAGQTSEWAVRCCLHVWLLEEARTALGWSPGLEWRYCTQEWAPVPGRSQFSNCSKTTGSLFSLLWRGLSWILTLTTQFSCRQCLMKTTTEHHLFYPKQRLWAPNGSTWSLSHLIQSIPHSADKILSLQGTSKHITSLSGIVNNLFIALSIQF